MRNFFTKSGETGIFQKNYSSNKHGVYLIICLLFAIKKEKVIYYECFFTILFYKKVLYPNYFKNWFWATRKFLRIAYSKPVNINNIGLFTIGESQGFGAAENPIFEVVWVYYPEKDIETGNACKSLPETLKVIADSNKSTLHSVWDTFKGYCSSFYPPEDPSTIDLEKGTYVPLSIPEEEENQEDEYALKLKDPKLLERSLSLCLGKCGLTDGSLIDLRTPKLVAKIATNGLKIAGFAEYAHIFKIAKKTLRYYLYLQHGAIKNKKLFGKKCRDLTTNKNQRTLVKDSLSIVTLLVVSTLALHYGGGFFSPSTIATILSGMSCVKYTRKSLAIMHGVKLFEKIESGEKPKKDCKMSFTVTKGLLKDVGLTLKAFGIGSEAREILAIVTGVMAYIKRNQYGSIILP